MKRAVLSLLVLAFASMSLTACGESPTAPSDACGVVQGSETCK